MTGAVEEVSFPSADENLETSVKSTLTKQAAMWFRIDGHLDRLLTALKHLASLITRMGALIVRMENRSHGPPPDYPQHQAPWTYIDYGDRNPQEPSWQNKALSIVGSLLVAGILAIFGVLWQINTSIRDLRGDNRVIIQRLDQQDEHLKANDRRLDNQDKRWEELDRAWPRKH